ncbi:hypothetical protein [Phocaeicola sp.]
MYARALIHFVAIFATYIIAALLIGGALQPLGKTFLMATVVALAGSASSYWSDRIIKKKERNK